MARGHQPPLDNAVVRASGVDTREPQSYNPRQNLNNRLTTIGVICGTRSSELIFRNG